MDPAIASRNTKYVIITPARDEARYIEETIVSVAQQTVPPAEWVIVDDGSTDDTGLIIERYAARYPWITALRIANRGYRDADIGAAGAILDGYRALKTKRWDFLVNLDADLRLEPQYFASCFEEFRKDPALGIGGGTLYCPTAAGIAAEVSPPFHVRGATKIYRWACWHAIDGLKAVPGWDSLDEVEASMAGWRALSFPGSKALHLRPTGAAAGGWRDAVKNGRSDYFLGYHPIFMVLKCVRRILKKPYFVNAAGHLRGFVGAYLHGLPQFHNKAVIQYVRKQQMRRLLLMDNMWK